MNPEDLIFEEFLAERIKHKGTSLKKLAEITGISQRSLQDLAVGNFSELPSAPYVRGYLIRLGQVLDFDGLDWWQKIKDEGRIKNSGATDSLPRNRFLKKSPMRLIVTSAVVLLIVIYLVFQLPRIIGKPDIMLSYPSSNPFSTTVNLITLTGSVSNADSLTINGDSVTIAPNGSWQKNILLPNSGVNTFDISAKKFLGGQTDLTEEIIYQPPTNGAVLAPGSATTTTASSSSSTAQ